MAAILCSGAPIQPPCFHVETEKKKVPKLLGCIFDDIIHFLSLQFFKFLFPLQHLQRPALRYEGRGLTSASTVTWRAKSIENKKIK